MFRNRSDALVLSAAVGATLLIYGPHLADPFVYQDANYAFTVPPLVVHGASLLLHLLNGLLVYGVLAPISVAPAFVSALFLLHPLNVEAVAYGAAQSELFILAGLLLLVWCVQRRYWLAGVLPILVLATTKLKGAPFLLLNPALPQGVSFLTWWRWEATAAWRLVRLWLVPIGLSIDHDTVHVPLGLQGVALAGVLATIFALLLTRHSWRAPIWLGIAWMLAVILPRFALRVPLSILNEHHFYPVTVGLALVTGEAGAAWLRRGCLVPTLPLRPVRAALQPAAPVI